MFKKHHFRNGLMSLAVLTVAAYAPVGTAALPSYSQNWEAKNVAGDAGAISSEGFVIGNINLTTGGQWFAGVGAPNNAADGLNGYSSLVTGEGGAPQGDNQLSIYSDYNGFGPFPPAGDVTVETFVYKDIGVIAADDLNKTYQFSFDAKLGNLVPGGNAQAWAYITVLKISDSSFAELANVRFESDALLTTDWSGGAVDVLIDPTWNGELLQIGFAARLAEVGGVLEGSGVFYDNLNFAEAAVIPVPAAVWLFGSGLLGLVGVARRRKG